MEYHDEVIEITEGEVKNAILSQFIKFHVWVLSVLVVALFTWVWNTSAQVRANGDLANRHEKSFGNLPTDMEVIKERQRSIDKKLDEVDRKLDKIMDQAVMDHWRKHGAPQSNQ